MRDLVVATRSAHKLRELRALLPAIPDLRLLDLDQAGIPESPDEEHIEVYETFRENALAKARFFAARCGAPVLADDSGLCVDALGGAPGVRSKRFSGRPDLRGEELDRANNEHLLRALEGVPLERRGGRYVCAVALVAPRGREASFEGTCEGILLAEPRGAEGFGYDPLFFVPEEGVTMGELPAERKNAISHRARAVAVAADTLERWLRTGEPA